MKHFYFVLDCLLSTTMSKMFVALVVLAIAVAVQGKAGCPS